MPGGRFAAIQTVVPSAVSPQPGGACRSASGCCGVTPVSETSPPPRRSPVPSRCTGTRVPASPPTPQPDETQIASGEAATFPGVPPVPLVPSSSRVRRSIRESVSLLRLRAQSVSVPAASGPGPSPTPTAATVSFVPASTATTESGATRIGSPAVAITATAAPARCPPFVEDPVRGLVRRQRVGLPAGPVQREHALGVEALPQRVCGDQLVELDDHLAVAPGLERRLDLLLARVDPEVFQAASRSKRRASTASAGSRSS